MIQTLPITEFDFDAGHLIWDVREPKAYAERHVKGAQNLPLGQIDAAAIEQTEGTLHVLCGGGTRAKKAAELIEQIDPTRTIVILQGGTRKAVAESLPTVAG